MRLRPPGSTLFPSTTLFRSPRFAARARRPARGPTRCPRPRPLLRPGAPPPPVPAIRPPWPGTARAGRGGRTDRPRLDGARASSVQPRLLDVALHALGHEVTDWPPLPDPLPDVRGGDGQGRDVHDAHVRMAGWLLGLKSSQVVAGPGGRDEVCELQDLVGVLPLEDLQHGVGTGHEEQIDVPAVLILELAKGVDRVRWTLPVHLQP